MIKIILWKICFEWAHLKRVLWPRENDRIYYFAFGANLSKEVMARRRIKVFDELDYALEGTALRFSQPGFYKDHGYASADVSENGVTYGKMYLILQSDAIRMDCFEGVPFLKVHEKIHHHSGEFAFFFYRAVRAFDDLLPTQEYLDYIVTAYRNMPDVPKSHTDSIATTPVLEQFVPWNKTGQFINDINRWPAFMHPTLTYYEGCCHRLVESLWNRSLVQWMIRM